MRGRRTAFLAAVLVLSVIGACGGGNQGTAALHTSSPTPNPYSELPASPARSGSQPTQVASPASTRSCPAAPGSPEAVVIDFPTGTGPQASGYDLALVSPDGCLGAHTHAAVRSYIHSSSTVGGAAAPDLPEVSASNGGVYFLDGDSSVRYLAPDGNIRNIMMLPGSATAHAGFAVSPDGTQIAVSVITYQGNSASMDLYAQNIDGTNHRDLFQSSSETAWPIAWHSGQLVLAVGPLFSQQGLWDNPYFATEYHVVNPTTANRLATIGGPDYMNGCEVSGLLVSTGAACYHRTATAGMGGEFWLLDWNGKRATITVGSADGGTASVNPDQSQTVALLDQSTPSLQVLSAGNKISALLNGPVDSWPCWIDDSHVLVGFVVERQFQPVIVDASTGLATRADARGFCAAILGGTAELH
jgi:hypothetical protein